LSANDVPKKRKPKIANEEKFRRCRLGELKRLFRDRWGPVLPDDDAGRGDLRELLLLASMASNGDRKMKNIIEVWAPWMIPEEAQQFMDDVNHKQTYLPKPSARILGDRLRLSSEARDRLAIRTIKPFDKSDAELDADRKAKDRERKWRKRRASGLKPREAWLANCNTVLKPWKKAKMSPRTWYRKRAEEQAKDRTKAAQVVGTGVSAVKLTTVVDRLVPPESHKKRKPRKQAA
jgi:hypothetical protein